MTSLAESRTQTRNMALLIDGDNAQASLIANVLAETAKYGTTTVRGVYGDWTTPTHRLEENAQAYALHPLQQFRHTAGKNATDSALIIDAMDLLHSGTIGGFCIVSSDSDFTRLATRIREQGLFVMGIGKPETPKPFVNACGLFVYTTISTPIPNTAAAAKKAKNVSEWTQTIKNAIEAASNEDEWAYLSVVGNHVRALEPAFDPRSFGHKKLSDLIKSRPDLFQFRLTEIGQGKARPEPNAHYRPRYTAVTCSRSYRVPADLHPGFLVQRLLFRCQICTRRPTGGRRSPSRQLLVTLLCIGVPQAVQIV